MGLNRKAEVPIREAPIKIRIKETRIKIRAKIRTKKTPTKEALESQMTQPPAMKTARKMLRLRKKIQARKIMEPAQKKRENPRKAAPKRTMRIKLARKMPVPQTKGSPEREIPLIKSMAAVPRKKQLIEQTVRMQGKHRIKRMTSLSRKNPTVKRILTVLVPVLPAMTVEGLMAGNADQA